jgi:hypothetical protein
MANFMRLLRLALELPGTIAESTIIAGGGRRLRTTPAGEGAARLPEPKRTRVFISYSQDNEAHRARVLALTGRLRTGGIDAVVDTYEQSPRQGWPAWCDAEIDKADFVLMVCTETYLRRVRGEEEPGKGHGVLWEARLIRQDVYDAGSASNKYVPVLFADGSPTHVPRAVRGASIYNIEVPEGYEALYRLLTKQPVAPLPPIGPIKEYPPLYPIDSSSEPERFTQVKKTLIELNELKEFLSDSLYEEGRRRALEKGGYL